MEVIDKERREEDHRKCEIKTRAECSSLTIATCFYEYIVLCICERAFDCYAYRKPNIVPLVP